MGSLRATPEPMTVRPVSRPGDRAERDADRAAVAVAEGRRVPRELIRPFGPAGTRVVHRQEGGSGDGGSSTGDETVEALKKTGEALMKTKAGQALEKKILDQPVVKEAKKLVTSTPGLIAGGVAVAGTVAGLAAAKKPLPFQAPAFPLDVIRPGLSGQITVTGPLNAPSFVGVTISFSPPSKGDRETAAVRSERRRAETARLAKADADFRAGLRNSAGRKEAEEERLTQEAIDYVVARSTRSLGLPGFDGPAATLPLAPRGDLLRMRKPEGAPVQRSASTASPREVPLAAVDSAVSGSGRPLEGAVRRSMERSFATSFAGVRIHDDARAARAAAAIRADAFTIGDRIAFGAGRHTLGSASGVRLLAHELAHVVQYRGSARGVGR